jgi:hypothetical protein
MARARQGAERGERQIMRRFPVACVDERTNERIGGIGGGGDQRHAPPLRAQTRYGKPLAV